MNRIIKPINKKINQIIKSALRTDFNRITKKEDLQVIEKTYSIQEHTILYILYYF